MDVKHNGGDRTSISARLRQLILYLAVPLCVLAVLVLVLLMIYSLQYAQISSNISTASQFNQNFKDEVDLKMYYFVTGSRDEIPWDEVETAEELATKLLGSTKNKESRRAANSVLNLCGNLKDSMSEIEDTDGYDRRMHRLENNVYVITELVQDYMYTYLYHEAGELAALRERQNMWLITGLILTVVVMVTTIVYSLRRGFLISRSITRPIDALYQRVTEIGQGDL